MSLLHMVHPETIKISTSGNTFSTTTSFVTLKANLKEDKPVEVIDDCLEITEHLIKEDEIYPIFYNGETIYVRKIKGAIEVFQIE